MIEGDYRYSVFPNSNEAGEIGGVDERSPEGCVVGYLKENRELLNLLVAPALRVAGSGTREISSRELIEQVFGIYGDPTKVTELSKQLGVGHTTLYTRARDLLEVLRRYVIGGDKLPDPIPIAQDRVAEGTWNWLRDNYVAAEMYKRWNDDLAFVEFCSLPFYNTLNPPESVLSAIQRIADGETGFEGIPTVGDVMYGYFGPEIFPWPGELARLGVDRRLTSKQLMKFFGFNESGFSRQLNKVEAILNCKFPLQSEEESENEGQLAFRINDPEDRLPTALALLEEEIELQAQIRGELDAFSSKDQQVRPVSHLIYRLLQTRVDVKYFVSLVNQQMVAVSEFERPEASGKQISKLVAEIRNIRKANRNMVAVESVGESEGKVLQWVHSLDKNEFAARLLLGVGAEEAVLERLTFLQKVVDFHHDNNSLTRVNEEMGITYSLAAATEAMMKKELGEMADNDRNLSLRIAQMVDEVLGPGDDWQTYKKSHNYHELIAGLFTIYIEYRLDKFTEGEWFSLAEKRILEMMAQGKTHDEIESVYGYDSREIQSVFNAFAQPEYRMGVFSRKERVEMYSSYLAELERLEESGQLDERRNKFGLSEENLNMAMQVIRQYISSNEITFTELLTDPHNSDFMEIMGKIRAIVEGNRIRPRYPSNIGVYRAGKSRSSLE